MILTLSLNNWLIAWTQTTGVTFDEATFHEYLDSYTNKGDWKSDISNLITNDNISNNYNLN